MGGSDIACLYFMDVPGDDLSEENPDCDTIKIDLLNKISLNMKLYQICFVDVPAWKPGQK